MEGKVSVVLVAAITFPSGPYAPASFIADTLKGDTGGADNGWYMSVHVSYLTNCVAEIR
jgi:hypothetical protein